MSIYTSYNKQNDTYYVYDTQYVFDEKKQRKVQKRRCIGKIDPVTKDIIPTGKRGRPQKKVSEKSNENETSTTYANDSVLQVLSKLSARINMIEKVMSDLTNEFNSAKSDYDELVEHLTKGL